MIDFETHTSHPISKLFNAGVINIPTLLILYPSPFNCFALDGSEEYNVIYYMHLHAESEIYRILLDLAWSSFKRYTFFKYIFYI